MSVDHRKAAVVCVTIVLVATGVAGCQRSASEPRDESRQVRGETTSNHVGTDSSALNHPSQSFVEAESNGISTPTAGAVAQHDSPAPPTPDSPQGTPEQGAQASPSVRSTTGPLQQAQQVTGQPPAPADDARKGEADQFELADLIELIEPAVVQVDVSGPSGASVGSGFVIDEKGIVVTNFHVVEGAQSGNVLFRSGTKALISGVLAAAPGRDLAILQIEGIPPGLTKSIPISETLPRSGERVVAFGSPKGFSFSATEGIVSAVRSGKDVQETFLKMNDVDVYGAMGYDRDVTWIQTSTPISHGNSGGPLVNTSGEVVGLNTWYHKGGQNLNFAVSAFDIAALYAQAGTRLVPLASLPGRSAPRSQGRSEPNVSTDADAFPTVELPSGGKLTAEMLARAMVKSVESADDDRPTFTWKYDSGAMGGVCAHERGKLHGVATALFESSNFMLLGVYTESRRNGPFLAWEESGQLTLFAQFTHGNRDGLVCLFRENKPWLVQEYEKGRLLNSYLVRHDRDGSAVIPENEAALEDDTKDELETAGDALVAVVKRVADEERQIKRRLATDFRKEYQRQQREYLTNITPERRRQQSERNRAHAEAASAVHRALRQRANASGLP